MRILRSLLPPVEGAAVGAVAVVMQWVRTSAVEDGPQGEPERDGDGEEDREQERRGEADVARDQQSGRQHAEEEHPATPDRGRTLEHGGTLEIRSGLTRASIQLRADDAPRATPPR